MFFYQKIELSLRFHGHLVFILQESQYRHDNRRRIQLEYILIDKPTIGHHTTNLQPPNLLPANPPIQINLPKPAMQNLHRNPWHVPGNNGHMKPIIPQKTPGKDQPGWCKSEAVVMLMGKD